MSFHEYWGQQWVRRALAVVVVLGLLAPVFAVAAEHVGYTEPLEVAAEATGATGSADPLAASPFPDYSAPGLSGPLGTLVSALLGSGAVLAVALVASRLLAANTSEQ